MSGWALTAYGVLALRRYQRDNRRWRPAGQMD